MNKYIQRLIKEQFNIGNMDLSGNKPKRNMNIFNKNVEYEDPTANKYYKNMLENGTISIKICNYLRDKINIIKVKSKQDLKKIIKLYKNKPFNTKSLNWLDVSEITDMSFLFCDTQYTGDISKWNVSNVTNMDNMFAYSTFNSNISGWNVSNVANMCQMFYDSSFNKDISKWDISNVTNMKEMFTYSQFHQNISNWIIQKNVIHDDMFVFCNIPEKYKPVFC